jgi:CCR4-NOT transcription complex subunit 6
MGKPPTLKSSDHWSRGKREIIIKTVMVSTAHIHWDPEYSDVKLIQTMMLISELKKIIEETIQNYKLGNTDINTIPLILCGDSGAQRI